MKETFHKSRIYTKASCPPPSPAVLVGVAPCSVPTAPYHGDQTLSTYCLIVIYIARRSQKLNTGNDCQATMRLHYDCSGMLVQVLWCKAIGFSSCLLQTGIVVFVWLMSKIELACPSTDRVCKF